MARRRQTSSAEASGEVVQPFSRRSIRILGVPLDMGASRRGVDMGPSALRVAGLNQKLAELGYLADDLGNIIVDQPESLPTGPVHARYLPQIAHTCARLAEMVERAADH